MQDQQQYLIIVIHLSDVIDDRIQTEAIIVCFDRSGSMDLVFEKNRENDNNDQQKRRPNTLNLHLTGLENKKKMKTSRRSIWT